MLAARTRITSVARRSFATVAKEAPKPVVADKKFRVVVVGGGPGGLSGKSESKKKKLWSKQ
jgi:sulfide:quinone oxidoreductase